MPKLISFTRNDRKPVYINPDFVIAVEPFRDDLTHSVIFTSGVGKGGADSRNYVVLGGCAAVAKMLEAA
ncbi:MAG: hypothetical protein EOO83_00235 [Oxalobacteraceae bacterium]|nr:MAG: hypothetical protein EOO83_00235 [Oxalobacteraceae bacterium]